VSQQLLFPERITLSEEEYGLLEQYEVSLAALGFDLRFEGDGVVDVHGLPSNVALEGMEHLLYELLQSFAEPIEVEQLRREQTALVMARNALKGSSQTLDEAQAMQLLAQLATCANYSFSPSGKAVFGAWSLEELRAKLG
jgi:DNA mismatch repair protein MutL